MIPFFAVAALSFGISFSTTIVSFIADELSEDERKKQDSLLKEYKSAIKKCEKERDDYLKNKIDEYQDDLQNIYEEESELYNRQMKADAKPSCITMFKENANDRLAYVDNQLFPEINAALNSLKTEKIKFNSSLRFNAFKLLKSELIEAQSKAKAYKEYLKKYIKMVEKIYDICDNPNDVIFSFRLPDHFPYTNKLIQISRDDTSDDTSFDAETGKGYTLIHKCIKIEYIISDYDYFKTQSFTDFTVMMTEFDSESYKYVYSIQHGIYKQIAKSGGFKGITAKVNSFDKNNISLIYGKDLILNLNAKYLNNFNRYPAIGSEITVFPIGEYYSKEKQRLIYNVSQRQEDSEISLDFHRIPLILPNSKAQEFLDYYKQNNIDLVYNDVKIAPIAETENNIIDPQKLRIQFGESFTIVVDVKQYEDESNQFLLWFNSFIEDKRLSAEEIFVPFNAEIDVLTEDDFNSYINSKTNSEVFENMAYLILTVFKEFKLQHQLKNSHEGLRYFLAWENITSRLKKYLEKGDSITCHTYELPEKKYIKDKGYILRFKVQNADDLRRYYKKILSEQLDCHYINEFFTEHKKVYYDVDINYDCESINIIIPELPDSAIIGWEQNNMIIDELQLISEITIYKRNYAIPELRQLRALHSFKIGNMQNKVLQTSMLDGNLIVPSYKEHKITQLFNPRLTDNNSQFESLQRSLNEENIFFIQGPPGTGKTTVIRELIAQTILNNKDSRILIVSQANVAVDNVIIGLLKDNMPFSKKDIIRCGKSGKISEEIADLSYEHKYNEYISSLKNLVEHSRDKTVQALSKEWLTRILSSHTWNPDVGELIIRNHKIIGATCVGLQQKRIGIDKISFDLVIIDEAGKALAPEIIIPIIQAKKAVIIGDHKQLPAVINPALYDEEKIEIDERQYCKKEIFDISFFQRLFESCPDANKSCLDTQYRMPAVVGTLISNLFYDGKLKNGSDTELKKPIYGQKNLSIIDMSSNSLYYENEKSSPTNKAEAEYVISLLYDICQKDSKSKIAVITPYRGQKKLIKDCLANCESFPNQERIHIDTVDSFQGDEAEIVIYCTTRSKKKTRFLSDKRRINVAISRTNNEFIMIASVPYLESFSNNEPIKQVFNYIKKNGEIMQPKNLSILKMAQTSKITIGIKEIDICHKLDENIIMESEIIREIEHFNKHGYFSSYPIVSKENNSMYIIHNHFEIYYAALQLSLSEITVVLTNSKTSVNSSKQVSIPKYDKIINN